MDGAAGNDAVTPISGMTLEQDGGGTGVAVAKAAAMRDRDLSGSAGHRLQAHEKSSGNGMTAGDADGDRIRRSIMFRHTDNATAGIRNGRRSACWQIVPRFEISAPLGSQ